MAEKNRKVSSRSIKKKKITAVEEVEEALRQVNDLTEQFPERKIKKRKPVRFEINTDPKTGLRDLKGTYNPLRSRKCHKAGEQLINEDISYEIETCEPEHPCAVEAEKSLIDMIDSCKSMLNSMPENSRKIIKWKERMSIMKENWANSRNDIFDCVVSTETIHSIYGNNCFYCGIKEAVVRCHQCGLSFHQCEACDERIHSINPFHDREIWNGSFFEGVSPMEKWNGHGQIIESERYIHLGPENCLGCKAENSLSYIVQKDVIAVVTTSGRFNFNNYMTKCMQCNAIYKPWHDLNFLVRNGYWPGSLQSVSYIFHQDLFRQWDIFQKRMPGTSQKSFIEGLEDFSSLKGRSGTINPTAFSMAFKEWKYCQFEMESLQSLNWMQCPCCDQEQHSCHVDGNMKLYRYKRSGKAHCSCYYGELFIANKQNVDTHLEMLYKEKHKVIVDNKCGVSTWKAASHGIKSAKLDETGLDIAGCRHSLAQYAVNMYQGELYGYAHYILSNQIAGKKINFFWQDIMCKFWKWANNADPEFKNYEVKPALSVMHAKAHKWTCQILWGGRWQEGAACSTGEEVEQINSYFSRLGNTTKYMLPEGRDELLTECAMAWNKRKISSMVLTLCKRYYRAIEMLKQSESELEDLLNDLKLEREHIDMKKWKLLVTQFAEAEEANAAVKTDLTTKEQYFLLSEHLRHVNIVETVGNSSSIGAVVTYQNFYDAYIKKFKKTTDIQKKICELEEQFQHESNVHEILDEGKELLAKRSLETLQEKIEMLYFSIVKRTSNISKLADTSKQRHKLRKKVFSEKEQIKQLLVRHSEITGRVVDCAAVLQGNFPWTDPSVNNRVSDIPLRLKATIVEKLMISERWKEEITLVKNEMERFLIFYSAVIMPKLEGDLKQLQEKLQSVSDNVRCELAQDDDEGLEQENVVRRYEVAVLSQRTVLGLQALKKKGLHFCIKQLNLGVEQFAKITQGNYSSLAEYTQDLADYMCDEGQAYNLLNYEHDDNADHDDDDDDDDSNEDYNINDDNDDD